jgi:hypothetical protein
MRPEEVLMVGDWPERNMVGASPDRDGSRARETKEP